MFIKKIVKGQVYYSLVESYRSGKKILYRNLLYLAKLEGLNAAQPQLLADRLESLLLCRYEAECKNRQVEDLARFYFGKLYSRVRGHSHKGQAMSVEGGSLAEDSEARINLRSLRPLRVREVGGEWVCL